MRSAPQSIVPMVAPRMFEDSPSLRNARRRLPSLLLMAVERPSGDNAIALGATFRLPIAVDSARSSRRTYAWRSGPLTPMNATVWPSGDIATARPVVEYNCTPSGSVSSRCAAALIGTDEDPERLA